MLSLSLFNKYCSYLKTILHFFSPFIPLLAHEISFLISFKLISDGEFKNIDAYKVLTNLEYHGTIMCVGDKIKHQQEYLSYIDYVDPAMPKNIVVVTELNTNYSPKFVAYCINNGKTCPFKVRKNKAGRDRHVVTTFKDTPFNNGDILQIIKAKQEPKAKMVDGEWRRDYTDKEWWIYEYNVKGGN